MIHVPALRWGKPYESLDRDRVVHFDTGEPVAEVSQAVPGMIRRDMRHAPAARDALREIAQTKLPDLNTDNIEQAVRIIEGTARSMGIEVN